MTDFCDGSGKIGYGGRVYPSSQAAFRKYRECNGPMCHPQKSVERALVENLEGQE